MSPEQRPVIGQAPAKINLTLEVLGRRRDGYHEVVTVMQSISLGDVLTFRPHRDIELACDVAELASPNNLAYRAARLMQGAARGRGVAISLSKGIPLAAGLGGGSSDAAATLLALDRMWGAGLAPARLMEMAAQLGSDVPFFVRGRPTALATGRGEKVSDLPAPPRTWLVLLRPPIELPGKTRLMYSRLDPAAFTGGEHAGRLRAALERGGRVGNRLCFNAFDALADSVFPGLAGYRRRLREAGAGAVHLAGAGPTLFTLVAGRDAGEGMVRHLKGQRMQAWLAHTLS